eukprot:tig00000889_g5291.t1
MPAEIQAKRISIEPNNCPIDAPLNLEVAYESSEAIASAVWELSYLVDMAGKRQVIALGSVGPQAVSKGANSFKFSVPAIDVSGVKKSTLANTGLLQCHLKAGAEEVVQLNIVTQISKKADGSLLRTMFDPLE